MAVLGGVLLIQAGVSNLTHALLPNARDYTELRSEVDGFILLVRSLNEAAQEARASGTEASWTEAAWIGVRGARDEMHDSARLGFSACLRPTDPYSEDAATVQIPGNRNARKPGQRGCEVHRVHGCVRGSGLDARAHEDHFYVPVVPIRRFVIRAPGESYQISVLEADFDAPP